jgi:ribosomal protein L37AE/L43A
MAIKVRKISSNSFVWSCTNCGASGTGATQFEANKNGVKHDRTVHGG